jgi:hypothetical protein
MTRLCFGQMSMLGIVLTSPVNGFHLSCRPVVMWHVVDWYILQPVEQSRHGPGRSGGAGVKLPQQALGAHGTSWMVR